MKFRTDKEIMKFFAASIGMALVGAVLFKYVTPPFLGGGLILGGLILTSMSVYVASKPKEYFMPDERTNKNMDKAGHAAFWIVMVTIIILDIFEILIPGTIIYKDANVVILYMGIYSFILFWWFYNKKGDIE
jgi:uncharacterized membrane protein